MRKKDAWEAGAFSTPTPHNNWRRGQQKLFAPPGLVAPPSTPETYGVPSTKGRAQAAREATEELDETYGSDAADAAYTILSIGIYGLPAIGPMQDPKLISSLSTSVASTNRELTTSPCCRYCRRRFEDEARLCKKCRGLVCLSCNAKGAWMCRTCGELEELQDADQNVLSAVEETRSDANARGDRRLIHTEEF